MPATLEGTADAAKKCKGLRGAIGGSILILSPLWTSILVLAAVGHFAPHFQLGPVGPAPALPAPVPSPVPAPPPPSEGAGVSEEVRELQLQLAKERDKLTAEKRRNEDAASQQAKLLADTQAKLREAEAAASGGTESLRKQLDEARKELEKARKARSEAEKQLHDVQAELKKASKGSSEGMADLQQQLDAAKAALSTAEAELKATQAKLTLARQELKDNHIMPSSPTEDWFASYGHQSWIAIALGILGLLSVAGPQVLVWLFCPLAGSALGGLMVAACVGYFITPTSTDAFAESTWMTATSGLIEGRASTLENAVWVALAAFGVLRWLFQWNCSYSAEVDLDSPVESKPLEEPLLGTVTTCDSPATTMWQRVVDRFGVGWRGSEEPGPSLEEALGSNKFGQEVVEQKRSSLGSGSMLGQRFHQVAGSDWEQQGMESYASDERSDAAAGGMGLTPGGGAGGRDLIPEHEPESDSRQSSDGNLQRDEV